MVDGKVKDLRRAWTVGERLWIWRLRMNMSQAQAAVYLGLTSKQYWKAEADIKFYPTCGVGKDTGRAIKGTNKAALCRLARRRHGEGLHGTARLLGISHTTLLQRESAGHPDLVTAWEQLGYKF